eukprot:1919180-Pyramimonas_sp.AAC.1
MGSSCSPAGMKGRPPPPRPRSNISSLSKSCTSTRTSTTRRDAPGKGPPRRGTRGTSGSAARPRDQRRRGWREAPGSRGTSSRPRPPS